MKILLLALMMMFAFAGCGESTTDKYIRFESGEDEGYNYGYESGYYDGQADCLKDIQDCKS